MFLAQKLSVTGISVWGSLPLGGKGISCWHADCRVDKGEPSLKEEDPQNSPLKMLASRKPSLLLGWFSFRKAKQGS